MAQARAGYPDFDITRSWELPHATDPYADESLEAYSKRIGFAEGQLGCYPYSLGGYSTANPAAFLGG